MHLRSQSEVILAESFLYFVAHSYGEKILMIILTCGTLKGMATTSGIVPENTLRINS